MTSKDVSFGQEARDKILKGLTTVANSVKVTMGPKGRTVIIERQFGGPHITKDGVTVANEISLSDKYENLGAQLIRQVASKTADVAGDGTTTATVLAHAIAKEGAKAVAAGLNPMDLKRGIDLAVSTVVQEIKNKAKPVSNKEEIAQVGRISANGDDEIGVKIAEAMEEVGRDGVITVEEARGLEFDVDVVKGMQFTNGYLSPYFTTNQEKMLVEFEDPFILIVDRKITSIQQLLPILESVVQTQKPILIVADDVEGEALATLVLNKVRAGLQVAAVKAPSFGDRKKAMMEDIAILTGGTVISEDLGLSLEKANPTQLGRAKRVIVSKESTTIVDGFGSKEAIDARVESIKVSIAESKSPYDQEKHRERLGKLTGGVAVLKVGGSTEVEVKERKDRVDDALAATRAAVEEGIVPGGGTTLLYATLALESLKVENNDIQAGINIVKQALRAPARQIADNAGVDGSVVVGKLLESTDTDVGFDAQNLVYTNMISSGIIDPAKVVRTALEDAASVSGLLITTEAAVITIEDNKPQQ